MSIFPNNIYMFFSSRKAAMSVKQTPHRRVPIHIRPRLPFGCAGLAVNIRLEEPAIHPMLHIIVRSDPRHHRRWLQSSCSLILKAEFSISGLLADEASFVNKVVMMSAEHHQVVHARLAAIGPMLYVVSIDKSSVRAPRKATTFISNA